MKKENKIIVKEAFQAAKDCGWKADGLCDFWRYATKCKLSMISACLYWNMPDCLKRLNIPDSVIRDIFAEQKEDEEKLEGK